MTKIAPLARGCKASIIYHKTSSIMPKTEEHMIKALGDLGIEAHCKNYQTMPRPPKMETIKLFPDQAPIEPHLFFCDHPEAIAEDIVAAMRDPENRLIIFPNGGNGMVEIVEILERKRKAGEMPIRDDMFFVGFSDTEKATNYLSSHGFGQAISASKVTGENLQELIEALLKDESQKQVIIPLNDSAKSTENISGVLISDAAEEHKEGFSRAEPSESGNILFIESFPRTLLESLNFYARNNMLGKVKAIMLSKNFTLNDELREVVTKFFRDNDFAEIPIFHGINSGHGVAPASYLMIRTNVVIEKKPISEEFEVEIDNLRSSENIAMVKEEIESRDETTRYKKPEVAEEYQAFECDGKVFCHAQNTSYGQRVDAVKALIDAADGKINLQINMPDFTEYDRAEGYPEWLSENQMVMAICIVPQSNLQLKTIKLYLISLKKNNILSSKLQEILWDKFYTSAPEPRKKSDMKFKTLKRVSLR